MNDCRSDFPCPGIARAMAPYRSPVSGREITTRAERAEDLKRHGCVDARDLKGMRLANGTTHRG
ncbi:hypothetical protein FPY71_11600 [Aureimonas fodinaquatilis]|uniref:Uncharacterized protein n=1 Tax=Aureimonas fodinaquatilis TaxID=2565783 RepID=A0A5B0DX84_9HYPH|nr:hypothetical protein [Aureimonas fodinaquatilis]KAA0971083.1 hypothetical protein FPY71_11600 [Aureimonas fodinaquatilis]